MGANPTQAQGVLIFLVAFVFIAAALYVGGNMLLALAGLVALGGATMLFMKCKPWEHEED